MGSTKMKAEIPVYTPNLEMISGGLHFGPEHTNFLKNAYYPLFQNTPVFTLLHHVGLISHLRHTLLLHLSSFCLFLSKIPF
jgi:hypothetical protein